MDANPTLSISTTISFTPSCRAVTSSEDIMSQDPSPTMTNTSRSGAAIRTPSPPATSYPMHE